MPNAIRRQKEEAVAELNQLLGSAPMVVVTHYAGVDTQSLTELRHALRQAGGQFKVVKNALAVRALEGTPNACLGEFLSGPAGLAWSQDPVAAPKAVAAFCEDNEAMTVIGGALDGNKLDANEITQLASMPSLDALRAKLAGLLMAPATKLATLLTRPSASLAVLMAARAKAEETS